MAIDLIHFPKIDDQKAIQEAASQGLQSMDHLIHLLSNNVDCSEITDLTVAKFKTVISLLNRTGHARFRRGPVHSLPSSTPSAASPPEAPVAPVLPQPENLSTIIQSNQSSVTLDFSKPRIFTAKSKSSEFEFAKENFSVSLNSSCISSGIIGDGDGSVSNGKGSSIFLTTAPSQPVISSGKPPLAVYPNRKRCLEHDHSESFSSKISGSSHGDCHCKKRKKLLKRTVRVPAISSKIADIPTDEYSWRKYGQKPIKGSPHQRGYYRCSMFKQCPAKKHVERALDDPTMLIVTYLGEHFHNKTAM